MSTMNVSLPESMKEFVDEQVQSRGYGSCSEYIRELIRLEQDKKQLRDLLQEAADAPSYGPIGPDYFEELRDWVRSCEAEAKSG